VVVLAAGEGKRMRSSVPKVLHEICGRSLLGHVLAAAAPLDAAHLSVVVGHGRDQVVEHLRAVAAGLGVPGAATVVQEQQHGTGHAVRLALEALPDVAGTVVVLNGDTPLLRAETLADLVAAHRAAGSAGTVLSAEVPDPSGLGRILRDERGTFTGIVEHADATPEQRGIAEVNAGMYVFDGGLLRDALAKLGRGNAQAEEYLTDCLGILAEQGHPVHAHRAADPTETLGVNDRVQLAGLRALLRDRLLEHWMREGVTVVDPATVWLDVDVTLAPDVVLRPGVQLAGTTTVGPGAEIGPDTTLTDTAVGEGARVLRSHCERAVVGPEASVGPFSFLRPGTVLARTAKVGAFVEIKASDIGEGTKVPHLTYVGDATIGEHTNIGASSVFVNYDGVAKHRTVIGSHARTGSDTMFIAPVTVGDGAYTAAGSVITDDVPPGAMGVARARQRTIEGWVERRRAGTPSAEAAARARQAAQQTPAPERAADQAADRAEDADQEPGPAPDATPQEPGRAAGR